MIKEVCEICGEETRDWSYKPFQRRGKVIHYPVCDECEDRRGNYAE